MTVNRLLSLAGRLLDGRHFASASIRQVALVLEKGWKEFASLLDLRTQVLGLSVTFHQKADQVTPTNLKAWNNWLTSPLIHHIHWVTSTCPVFQSGPLSVTT